MPLVLTVAEGDDVFVKGHPIVIDEVVTPTHMRIRSGKQVFDVVDTRATEVIPDVLFSVGEPHKNGALRLMIEAPPSVPLIRGYKYREGEGRANGA